MATLMRWSRNTRFSLVDIYLLSTNQNKLLDYYPNFHSNMYCIPLLSAVLSLICYLYYLFSVKIKFIGRSPEETLEKNLVTIFVDVKKQFSFVARKPTTRGDSPHLP